MMKKIALVVAALLTTSDPTQALVMSGTSSAFGLHIDLVETLTVNGVTTVTNYTFAGANLSATAAPPYNTYLPLLTVSSAPGNVTWLMAPSTLAVYSDVDGSAGDRVANASVSSEGFSLTLASTNYFVFQLAGDFMSSAEESGDVGAFSDAGSTTLTRASLYIDNVVTQIPDSPTPNYIAYNTGGLLATIFEVGFTSNDTSEFLSINAAHLYFDDFVLFDETVGSISQRLSYSGEVIVGHADARLSATAPPPPTGVPEPNILALLTLGLAGLSWNRRNNTSIHP